MTLESQDAIVFVNLEGVWKNLRFLRGRIQSTANVNQGSTEVASCEVVEATTYLPLLTGFGSQEFPLWNRSLGPGAALTRVVARWARWRPLFLDPSSAARHSCEPRRLEAVSRDMIH